MCSDFDVGSYLRLIDFVYHSRLESNNAEQDVVGSGPEVMVNHGGQSGGGRDVP